MEYGETLSYYDDHAEEFYQNTVTIGFEAMQDRFLSKIEKGSKILDLGCGSGRDTKYFLEQGYHVKAVDGSIELCRLASQYTGIKVEHMYFQDLADIEEYDGIWACSSILHLPVLDLVDVMGKMAAALKDRGIIYTSFKYGTFSGIKNGRFFTDMTEDTFARFLRQVKGIELEEQWVASDLRPKRGGEKWLNLILRKN